jgi:hypothetical protein
MCGRGFGARSCRLRVWLIDSRLAVEESHCGGEFVLSGNDCTAYALAPRVLVCRCCPKAAFQKIIAWRRSSRAWLVSVIICSGLLSFGLIALRLFRFSHGASQAMNMRDAAAHTLSARFRIRSLPTNEAKKNVPMNTVRRSLLARGTSVAFLPFAFQCVR